MTPPAAVLLLPDPHVRLIPPAAALVGDGGSEDRIDPRQALRDPFSPFTAGLQGSGGPVLGKVFGTGYPLLPVEACVGGGPHPWPGAGEIIRVQPGWNGASLALTILCPS